MVSVTLTGFVVSAVSFSTTSAGAPRASFIMSCPEENSLPLHFDIAAFGKRASEAEALVRGMKLLVSGRLTAGGKTKKVSLSVSHLEVLALPAEPVSAEEVA